MYDNLNTVLCRLCNFIDLYLIDTYAQSADCSEQQLI